MNGLTDNELWMQFLETKPDPSGQAFSELYNRHRERLVQRCRFRGLTYHDAEDCAAMTFLRMVDARPGWFGSFRAYLNRVLDNVIRDQLRSCLPSQCSWHGTEEPNASLAAVRDAYDPQPLECVIRQEDIQRLILGLAELCEEMRFVVRKRFFEDWTLLDIAKSLNIDPFRAYRLIDQALRQLRRILSGQGQRLPQPD